MPNDENCTSGCCTGPASWCCGPRDTIAGKVARALCAISACALDVSFCSAITPSLHIAGLTIDSSTLLLSSAITAGVGAVGCAATPCIGHKCCGWCNHDVQLDNYRTTITIQPARQVNIRNIVPSAPPNLESHDGESTSAIIPSAPLLDNPPSYAEAIKMIPPIQMPSTALSRIRASSQKHLSLQ